MVGTTRVWVVPWPRPRAGQVWAFVLPDGRLVAHRCLRGGRRLRFQGDANRRPDSTVPPTLLVGRVTAVESGGRWRRLGVLDQMRGLVVLAGHLGRRVLTRLRARSRSSLRGWSG